MSVDTLGNLLAVVIDPANEQDRSKVGELADAVHRATGNSVELAYADQSYSGENAREQAEEHGIEPEVVKLPTAKKGFVLLPRRWVVERSFGWLARFRRLARDYERLPGTLARLHLLAFSMLMFPKILGQLAELRRLFPDVLG